MINNRKTSVDDLTYGKSAKRHLQMLQDVSIAKRINECPFQPEISQNSRLITSHAGYNFHTRMQDDTKLMQKRRELESEQERKYEKFGVFRGKIASLEIRMKEYNELKECTFDPKINKDIPDSFLEPKLGKIVSGAEAYLEQRDRAKRMKQAEKNRKEKVFNIENKYDPIKHQSYTTPKPFNFAKVMLRDENEQQLICIFKRSRTQLR